MMLHLCVAGEGCTNVINDFIVFENHSAYKLINEQPDTVNTSRTRILDIIMLAGYLVACKKMNDQLSVYFHENIINTLLKNFTYVHYACTKDRLSDSAFEIFLEIADYIFTRYTHKISLSDFAQQSHFNKSYIANLVKSNLNLTFNETLSYVRCLNAEHLLLTTELSNSEISNMCGFSDVKYFYNTFKVWYGKTPSQHRKFYESYILEPTDYYEPDEAEIKTLFTDFYCEYNCRKILNEIK